MIFFNNFKKIFFLNSNLFNYYEFLIFFLPITAILGNFALNVNIILLSIIFLYFFKKEKIIINSRFRNICLIIFLFLLVNIFQSYNLLMSLSSFIGFLSHFILFLSVYYYFIKSEKNIKRFSFSLIIVMVFCCYDIIFQFFFGIDLFGFETFLSHGE